MVCTPRVCYLRCTPGPLTTELECIAAGPRKKASRHGWLPAASAGLHDARLLDARRHEASRYEASCHDADGAPPCPLFQILQLQHFHVGQPPIIQRLCTWAVHVGLCMSCAWRCRAFRICDFFWIARRSTMARCDHGSLQPCLLTCFAAFIFASIIFASLLCWRHSLLAA